MNKPWNAEFDAPEELVRELIDGQFPEFKHQPLTLIGEGWDNSAWQVGDDWVFRIPRRQLGADLVATEAAVVPAIVDRLTVPVSCPLRVGQPTDSYPWPFAGYRLISGVELCEAAPPADRRLRLAEELGAFLKSLHSIPASEGTKLGAPPDTIGRLDIERRAVQATEQLSRAVELELIDRPELWVRLLERLIPECESPGASCLVHGDLYSRHVIVKSQKPSDDHDARVAGIIDWGDVHVGEPAADLACAWSLFDRNGRRRLLECYGEVAPSALALARFRAIGHSVICAVYGREAKIPALEKASKDALHWLLED